MTALDAEIRASGLVEGVDGAEGRAVSLAPVVQGAGYIGSTVASACLDAGITPVILDSLVRGRREFTAGRVFYEGDIADGALVDRVFAEHSDISAVVHCAALIVVPESVADPIGYYEANVAKSLAFVSHLHRNGCDRIIFSSSASVYRAEDGSPVDEDSPLAPLRGEVRRHRRGRAAGAVAAVLQPGRIRPAGEDEAPAQTAQPRGGCSHSGTP